MNLIELFAGAAGLAQGFERTGHYQTMVLYDVFDAARASYSNYRPDVTYSLHDIRKLRANEVREALNGHTLHGIIGGPPCQGFSLAGKRLTEDEINQLVLAYERVVTSIEPPFLVLENVPQLMFHSLFDLLLKRLRKRYNVIWGILNAARYGTPQTRHRLFLIAYHKRFGICPTLPAPTHGPLGQQIYTYNLQNSNDRVTLDEATADVIFGADPVIRDIVAQQAALVSNDVRPDLKPLVTVGNAISDLAESIALEGECVAYATPSQSDYQCCLRKGATSVANCFARQHKGAPLKIVQTLREGGTPNVGATRGKRYYSQAYSRLHRDGLARTLTTSFQNAGSGRFFHYEQPRTLSVREAARLQGFPDDFVFFGTIAEQMQLVGNAVPLPLAEAVGRHIAGEIGPCLD
ncbi:MAG: DNA cytosine methyltransferase [Aggregatilineales bacterium]